MSKIEYRLAWARNGLKLIGAIENSAREGVWSVALRRVGNSGRLKRSSTSVKDWRAEYNRQYLWLASVRREISVLARTTTINSSKEIDSTIEAVLAGRRPLDRLLQMSPSCIF